MKRLPRVAKQDYKFVPARPDPGFSPEHNAQVIENTIKKYEAMRKRKSQEHTERVEERSQAVATFLKSFEQGGKQSDISRYFGKKHLAYLRGQDILQKLKEAEAHVKVHKA